MSGKTDAELLAVLSAPADASPEVVDAAKIELWKRHSSVSGRASADFGEPPAPPQLSSLAVYSLVLFLLPYFGLPMAISALRRIKHSEGRLYGRKLAWVSIIINVLSLLFWLGVIALSAMFTMMDE